MKKTVAILLAVMMLASCMVISTNAAVKAKNVVGSVVYPRYVTEAPNLKEGIIDDTWGEKTIHLTKNSKNAGITLNSHDYGKDAKPEMNTYCDIWICFNEEYIFFAFQTNDTSPLGGRGGDSVCLMMEAGNPKLTYICTADPNTADRYNYHTVGVHLTDDDFTPSDYGVNEKLAITWLEKDGGFTIKCRVPLSFFSVTSADLDEGFEFNFNFMRNILTDPLHYHAGDGRLYWGKWFDISLANEADPDVPGAYVIDDANAKGPNTMVLYRSNTVSLVEDKLLTAEEYLEKMGTEIADGSAGEQVQEEPKEETPVATETPSSWAAEEVNAAVALGLVPTELQKGYTTGITRGQLALMLSSLLTKAGVTLPTSGNATFTDTTDANVLAAANLGIINGYKQSDGTYMFKPNNTLKRSEMSAIINRVAKLCGKTTTGFESEVTFTDTASHWCNSELGYPVHMGIVKGTSATTFSPENTLTIEQTVMMVYRTLNALAK